MAAMKPRTGDGPIEAVREARSTIVRVPLDGGGRLVLSLDKEEVQELGRVLLEVSDLARDTSAL